MHLHVTSRSSAGSTSGKRPESSSRMTLFRVAMFRRAAWAVSMDALPSWTPHVHKLGVPNADEKDTRKSRRMTCGGSVHSVENHNSHHSASFLASSFAFSLASLSPPKNSFIAMSSGTLTFEATAKVPR